jgi:hypothetical protein
MTLSVSRPFIAPPAMAPSAAPIKLTAKAVPKPATKPTPPPVASMSRRDAPKRQLASTHVNVEFNSPDKVQMYYEDARAGNVWHEFGEWGSTWRGRNELDIDPSQTSANGGTRFKVVNNTTGQTFIVDKSNATFTTLPDGRTRIAIEDRPGTNTPGADIVLLLEPKYVPVKPSRPSAPKPTAPKPTAPKGPTRVKSGGRKLLTALDNAIDRLTRVFPRGAAWLPADNNDVAEIIRNWRASQPQGIPGPQLDTIANRLTATLRNSLTLTRGFGRVTERFLRDLARGRIVQVATSGDPQQPAITVPTRESDGYVQGIRISVTNGGHLPDNIANVLRDSFSLRFAQDTLVQTGSPLPVELPLWSLVAQRSNESANSFGAGVTGNLHDRANLFRSFLGMAIEGVVIGGPGTPLESLIVSFWQRLSAQNPGLPPIAQLFTTFTTNGRLAEILRQPLGNVLPPLGDAGLDHNTPFGEAIATVMHALTVEQNVGRQFPQNLQAGAMSMGEFLLSRGNKYDRGGAGGMAVLAGPRAIDLAADGSLSMGYMDKRGRYNTVKINLGDGPNAKHLMDPWQAIAKLDPKDGDRQKLMPHIDHREQFLNALKMMQQLKAGQSIQQVLADAPRNKASKDAAHGAMMLMGCSQDQITHLAGLVSREGIGAQATTKGKIAAQALTRALRLRQKFDDAKYPLRNDRARGGLDWGAALSASKVGRLANVKGRLNTVHQSPWLDKLLYGQIFPGAESAFGGSGHSLRDNMIWAGRALAQLSITSLIGSLVSPAKQRP